MIAASMQPDKIQQLLTGSDPHGTSSAALNWDGLLVHRRKAEVLDRPEITFDQHYVLVWEGEPSTFDRSEGGGPARRHVKRPGTVSMGMAGIQPDVRSLTPFQVTAALIDPIAVREVAREADLTALEAREDCLGGTDAPLVQLIRLSALEADGGGASGALYGSSLVMAIMTRFIHLALLDQPIDTDAGPALAKSRLRRVIDMMQAEFAQNLSLEALSAQSGYSRAHFLRMFRSATGKTPHRYLQDLRLDFARQQLGMDTMSITEIAYAAGFSSHAHLTKLFGEKFGTTPSLFRRFG